MKSILPMVLHFTSPGHYLSGQKNKLKKKKLGQYVLGELSWKAEEQDYRMWGCRICSLFSVALTVINFIEKY